MRAIKRKTDGATGCQPSMSTSGWNVGTFVFSLILWCLSPIIHPRIKEWWNQRGRKNEESGGEELQLGPLQSGDASTEREHRSMSRGQSPQGSAIAETTKPLAPLSSDLDATAPDSMDDHQPSRGE
jgi:hypothetical protein